MNEWNHYLTNMKYFFFNLSLFLCIFSYAQFEPSNFFLYTGANALRDINNGATRTTLNQITPILGIYKVDKKRNINEFQFNEFRSTKYQRDLYITNGSGLQEEKITSLSVSYHKIIGLNKKKESPIYLGLGIGTQVYFKHRNYINDSPSVFNRRTTKVGSLLSIQPVINYSLSQKLFIGASSSFYPLDLSATAQRTENPTVPQNQQSTYSLGMDYLNKREFNLQLIIGVNLT